MNDVLKVGNLVKNYGSHQVLKNVSLTVSAGSIHGLLGPNGAGKTTLLHIVAGILHRDGGEVTICGVPVTETLSRSYIGFVPDDLPLPAVLTGEEFLAFHDSMRGLNTRDKSYEIAEIFEISKDLNRSIGEYSHGMKKKLQTIAAISHNPKLLILDEPYRGLDPRSFRLMREIISRFSIQGSAVIVATHDMLQAQTLCNYASIIHNGEIVTSAKVPEILASCGVDTLEDSFFYLTRTNSSVDEAIDAIGQVL